MNRKIDHLNITVNDIDKSVKFYKEVLGFNVTNEFNNGNIKFVFLSDGNISYELMENKEVTVSTFDHIAYVSNDIYKDYEFYKSIDELMIESEVKFIDFMFNGVYFFFIRGVNGERIEFCQRKE